MRKKIWAFLFLFLLQINFSPLYCRTIKNDPFCLYDVQFFGKIIGNFNENDLHSLRVTPEALLHITRHFAFLDPKVKKNLVGLKIKNGKNFQVVDETFIELQLTTLGSKFHEKLGDPAQMIEFAKQILAEALSESVPIYWIQREEQIFAFFQLNVSHKKELLGLSAEDFLGTQSIVKITPENSSKVIRETRGQGELADRKMVNVIYEASPPLTDNLVIILKKDKNHGVEIGTIYSGIITPYFPSSSLCQEELHYSQEWWNQHAFLK